MNLAGQSWSVGVKGGPSWSRINAERVRNENSRFGYYIGLWGEIYINKTISIQPEFNYLALGATNEGYVQRDPRATIKWKYNLNYLSIPINLNYHPHKLITIGTGIYTGFLVGFNVSREAAFSNILESPKKSNLKTQDFGYQISFGINYSVISIELRYRHSLSELPDSRLAELLIDKAQNSAVQIAVAYALFQKHPK